MSDIPYTPAIINIKSDNMQKLAKIYTYSFLIPCRNRYVFWAPTTQFREKHSIKPVIRGVIISVTMLFSLILPA